MTETPEEKIPDLVMEVKEEIQVRHLDALTDALTALLSQDVLQAVLDHLDSQLPLGKVPGFLSEVTFEQCDYRITIQRQKRFTLGEKTASTP